MYKIFSVLKQEYLKGLYLAPYFFFIYVIDFSGKKIKAMCMTLADDNSLQYSLNNIAEIQCCINQDFKILYMWSKQSLHQSNPTRTKAVFFTLKRQLTHLNYSSNSVH